MSCPPTTNWSHAGSGRRANCGNSVTSPAPSARPSRWAIRPAIVRDGDAAAGADEPESDALREARHGSF